MKPRRILSRTENAEIVEFAVRDGALAVVSFWHGDEWRSFKSRFLERDANRRFFVLDCQDLEESAQLALGQYVGISFRYRSRKIMFTTVLEARGKFVLRDNTTVAAARYRWPDCLTELQRRAYYRTPIPAGVSVLTSLWSGGRNARNVAQAKPLAVLAGEAQDLSCGGMLVHLNTDAAPNWPEDHTIGIELHLPDGRPPMIVDGLYRGARMEASNRLSAAVQFVGMEMSDEGRVSLQRLARCVQRLHRLTLEPELKAGVARLNFG